jgi:hypothetical protein
MTTSGLFRQDQAHSPAFFSVSRATGHHADDLAGFGSHAREPERSIS